MSDSVFRGPLLSAYSQTSILLLQSVFLNEMILCVNVYVQVKYFLSFSVIEYDIVSTGVEFTILDKDF